MVGYPIPTDGVVGRLRHSSGIPIARRICTLEWTLHTDPERWFDAPESHRRGMRDRTDPVYWPLADADA